jgi:hypothetical protein
MIAGDETGDELAAKAVRVGTAARAAPWRRDRSRGQTSVSSTP